MTDARQIKKCAEDFLSSEDFEIIGSDETMSLIGALDKVQSRVYGSKLSDEFFRDCEMELQFLNEKLQLTPFQSVVIAIMCEVGEGVTWRRLGKFIGVSRLSLMEHSEEIDQLIERRWLIFGGVREERGMYDGFCLPRGIIKAFRNGETFVPENIQNLTEQQFVNRLVRYMNNEGQAGYIPFEENHRYMNQLCELNPHLPLCQEVGRITNKNFRIALLVMVYDYISSPYAGGNPGVGAIDWSQWFDEGWESDYLTDKMEKGQGELFDRGLVEHAFADGLVDTSHVRLTPDAIKRFLSKCKPNLSNTNGLQGWLKPSAITEKRLVYNPAEREAVNRLKEILEEGKLDDIQTRLKQCGMRAGITCLFYGAPGTGKTETALQLARSTGRPVMQVNIAGMRDKFVGESEKNIKRVFDEFRELCKNEGPTPILLFNEADALIHSRFEKPSSSVDKMDNAMQNIILQELETLDGILIATTNLTASLDKAMERRFLFKIEFVIPDAEARAEIWHDMLPNLPISECKAIAREVDMSGGEIENVARKCKIEFALTSMHPTLARVREFCRDEKLNRMVCPAIGFH